MSLSQSKIAVQLREFIDTNHIYADELSDEQVDKIRDAAEKEAEQIVPFGITKRK
ncbi:hypothetical protein GcM3_159016, partial [Golovinomyces cichoracearum]